MSLYEDFNERRTRGNERVMGENFLPFKRFYSLDSMAYAEGALPAKYKELMGLTASLVLRCNDCVLYHIAEAFKAGASRAEIIEATNIALVVGGSIVIPHLRLAVEAIDELFNISEEGK